MGERRFSEDEPVMVSIRCITYNHAPYIRQCLDGFVMQKTNFRFQAVVHDDASTDGTTDILREYAEKYPDIIVPMYEEENRWSKHDGTILACMLPLMTGKYIAECEGDDCWIDPLKLQKQFDALEKHPECTICFCKVQMVTKKGTKMKYTIPEGNAFKEGIYNLEAYIKHEYGKCKWSFQSSSYFMKRDYYMRMKNSDDFFSHFPYSDQPQILWCLLHGDAYYIPETCSNYTVMSGGYNSMSKSNKDFAISQELKFISSLEYFDDYTKKKYHNHVSRRIKMGELYIELYKEKYYSILLPKYLKESILFPFRTWIVLLSHWLFPSLYNKVKKEVRTR